MLGTRDLFSYWECAHCGCLSLLDPPSDPAKYYPQSYYSFRANTTNRIRRLRTRLYLSPPFVVRHFRRRTDLDVIRTIPLRRNMSILDVGCGAGCLIGELRELGYTAEGLDPFIPADIYDRFGLRVRRSTLDAPGPRYDVVLFRHSLEHMPLPSLRFARSLIADKGLCVVCIPIVGWAWTRYRTNWVQLDPPRHLFLHTRKSFELLATANGFQIERVVFDSSEFQFWASEAYEGDIPLALSNRPNLFQIIRMRRAAAALNKREIGDSAQFYLRRI